MFIVSEQQQICDVYPSVSAETLYLISKYLLVCMSRRSFVYWFGQTFYSCSYSHLVKLFVQCLVSCKWSAFLNICSQKIDSFLYFIYFQSNTEPQLFPWLTLHHFLVKAFLAGNNLHVCQTSVSSLRSLLSVPCRYITAQLLCGEAHLLLCFMGAFTSFQKEIRCTATSENTSVVYLQVTTEPQTC